MRLMHLYIGSVWGCWTAGKIKIDRAHSNGSWQLAKQLVPSRIDRKVPDLYVGTISRGSPPAAVLQYTIARSTLRSCKFTVTVT